MKIVLIVIAILAIPFFAMLFTDEVKWRLFDFIIAFILLTSAGLVCKLIFKKVPSKTTRFILIGLLFLILLLIWLELAVGIFGSPIAGN